MLRERAIGESLWEAPELAKVGAVLDDDRFLAPWGAETRVGSGEHFGGAHG